MYCTGLLAVLFTFWLYLFFGVKNVLAYFYTIEFFGLGDIKRVQTVCPSVTLLLLKLELTN